MTMTPDIGDIQTHPPPLPPSLKIFFKYVVMPPLHLFCGNGTTQLQLHYKWIQRSGTSLLLSGLLYCWLNESISDDVDDDDDVVYDDDDDDDDDVVVDDDVDDDDDDDVDDDVVYDDDDDDVDDNDDDNDDEKY